MKLEKLLGLIRLANNNNSEGEANAAARKVCQILAGGYFRIEQVVTKTAAGKMNEARTWNDVKRSTEPEFRSRQWTGNPSTGPSPFDEFFRGWSQRRNPFRETPYSKGFWDNVETKSAPTDDEWKDAEAERKRNEEKRKQHASNYANYNPFRTGEYSSGLADDEEWQWDHTTGTRKKVKKQEMRKCAKCGLEILTYRLKEDPWICNPCHWKDKL
jgi:hypothetical protein